MSCKEVLVPMIDATQDMLAEDKSLWLHVMQAAALYMPLSSIGRVDKGVNAACNLVAFLATAVVR